MTHGSVGGVDASGSVDRIYIENAVETPFWMAIYATEPERTVDVRMTYSDLKIICDLIDMMNKFSDEPCKDYEKDVIECP